MRAPRIRSAFTMVELLVVLGILVVLSTIGVGAFLTTSKVNRLTATENLLAGLIRQARYTARTTGQAVMIYANTTNHTIAGVTRLAVWQTQFEAGQDVFVTATPSPLIADGLTGSGVACRQAGTSLSGPILTPSIDIYDSSVGRSALSGAGNPNRKLSRHAGKPTDGFALTAALRTPPTTIAAFAPLVMLTSAADANTDTAATGLLLREASLDLYDTNPPTFHPPTALSPTPSLITSCWEIIGWITPVGGPPISISSLENSPRGNDNDTKRGRLGIDTGSNEEWHEYGLIYTNDASTGTLELQRDGEMIAYKIIPNNQILIDDGTNRLTAHFGHAIIGSAFSGTGVPVTIDPIAAIDDVSLFRIGVDKATRLPAGVEFDGSNTAPSLLIQPNGSIGKTGQMSGAQANLTWIVRGVFAEQEDKAELTINPTTGLVAGSKLVLSPNP